MYTIVFKAIDIMTADDFKVVERIVSVRVQAMLIMTMVIIVKL